MFLPNLTSITITDTGTYYILEVQGNRVSITDRNFNEKREVYTYIAGMSFELPDFYLQRVNSNA